MLCFFFLVILYVVILSCLQAGGTDTTFLRSGNPGYIVGEPVVAGTLNATVDNKYPFEHFLMN